ncbi:MAG: hypothetical protein J5510_08125 [Prevotella sp.]|nr:hypothetical protein [Prevotella sp.]
MANINITINKAAIISTVESLLWKYGKAIEGADNYKQVYNTHSEHGVNTVDNKVLSDSFIARSREAIELLRDYMSGAITYDTAGNPSVTLAMSTRWSGRQSTLQSMVDEYVSDGMMADWLHVTSPNEAAIYNTKLVADADKISSDIHSLGRPNVS